MRVSELSERSGVSVASIKYYVREGLLAGGTRTSTNQAVYTDEHVRRLRLIRSLIDVGGLPISNVRATLAAVDSDSTSMHDAFGAVMHGLDGPAPDDVPDDVAQAYREVKEWISTRQWNIEPDAPAAHRLAELVATLRRFEFPFAPADFDGNADMAERSAEVGVAYARSRTDRTAAVETMLIGTVILERALVEVRRLALEAVSFRVEIVSNEN